MFVNEEEYFVKRTPKKNVSYEDAYWGEIVDPDGERRDRKRFSKGKHCFFKSNNIEANWKDPKTYSWLVNEFGKISAARVSGVSRKHQRYVTTAIKRARNLGIISHLSNRTIGDNNRY